MNTYTMLGELIAQNGKRDELKTILLSAKELLERTDDCLLYDVSTSEEHPNSIFVYEKWTSEEAHGASLQDREVLALIMKGKPLIEDMKQHHKFETHK